MVTNTAVCDLGTYRCVEVSSQVQSRSGFQHLDKPVRRQAKREKVPPREPIVPGFVPRFVFKKVGEFSASEGGAPPRRDAEHSRRRVSGPITRCQSVDEERRRQRGAVRRHISCWPGYTSANDAV